MFCPNCGRELPGNAVFCGGCGIKIDDYIVWKNPDDYPARENREIISRNHSDAAASDSAYDIEEPEIIPCDFADRFNLMQDTDDGDTYTAEEMSVPRETQAFEETYVSEVENDTDCRFEKTKDQYPEGRLNETKMSSEPEHSEKTGSDEIKRKAISDVKNMAGIPVHLSKIGSADKTGQGLEQFYIADFLMRLFGIKENIPLCIYLVMNILLIGFIASAFTGGNVIVGMLTGLILYIISMSLALSKYGEAFLRSRSGFVPVEETELNDRLTPIFQEVYNKAGKMNPRLPGDIKLYVNDDASPNAFATGRRTVCVTRGMLAMSDDQIKGALGHEFGHLSHMDTDRILVITIGNIFVTAFCVLMHIGAYLMQGIMHIIGLFLGEDGFILSVIGTISTVLTVKSVDLFLAAWTGMGSLLCMKTSRGNEYQADEFSCRLGYGEGLISVLQSLGSTPKPTGLFATLAASHPPMDDRITRIRYLVSDNNNANH